MSALTEAIIRKARESAQTIERLFAENSDRIAACAIEMAARFDAGGRLYTLGNGGSAADAMHVAVEFMHPVIARRPAIPAIALSADSTLMSAIANDQDFSQAYAHALRIHGKPGDVVLALSTSGKSASVNRALAAAKELGMLTVGFSGKDGGKLVGLCDHAFVVPSYAIHRIQEAHVALLHVLWDAIHVVRGEEDVTG
ncbi:MAG TPA: SIS domain-containing protein [Kofleriaceae bacterium]